LAHSNTSALVLYLYHTRKENIINKGSKCLMNSKAATDVSVNIQYNHNYFQPT